ncbi:MAG: transposase domain-containing protein [Thiomicrospira sp.]
MMKEWFSAKELIGLPGMPSTVQGVRQKADCEGWDKRKKEKGKGSEYHVSALPETTRLALIVQSCQVKSDNTDNTDKTQDSCGFDWYSAEDLWAHYAVKPQKQKDKALAKVRVFDAMLALMEAGLTQTKALEKACAGTGFNWKTLNNSWHGLPGKPGIKRYARADWAAALIPGYCGRQEIPLDPWLWDRFLAYYLTQEQRSITACYEYVAREANEKGLVMPSKKTFERRVERLPVKEVVLAREGYEALNRLFPSLKRTVAAMFALDHINGDGYQHNRRVKFPDGEVTRPKTWVWQDVYSRKILAYRVGKTENTDTIRVSFGEVVEKYGIPNHVTIDNTRAAANKAMTGGIRNRYRFKVKDDDPEGLFVALGIEVHWTSVDNQTRKGHGQAKPIERAFGVGGLGEWVDKHPSFAPGSYTGTSPVDKPENHQRDAYVEYADFMRVIDDEIKHWNAREGRRTEMAMGIHSFDTVFNESYARATIRKASAEQRRLWLLQSEPVLVQRDGTINTRAGKAVGFGANRYGADTLLQFRGKKVVVRFDPDDLHQPIAVYSLDNRFICMADLLTSTGFRDTDTAREHNRARTQFRKATKQQLDALKRMNAIEAAKFLPQADESELPSAGSIAVEFGKTLKVGNGADVLLDDTVQRAPVDLTLFKQAKPIESDRNEQTFIEEMSRLRGK